jgi:hypothetical protein
MDLLRDIGTELLKASTVIAVMAVLGKLAVDTLLKADLETHKADLKAQNDAALATSKHDFDKRLADYRNRLDVTTKSDERIRAEIIAWANPIRDAAESLQHRLGNVLARQGYQALAKGYAHADWSISYEYFMTSTLYLFARYFSWIHMLRQELSFELFRSQADRVLFFQRVDAVADALGSYDDGKPPYVGTGHDTQVFRLQQQAIGEYMTLRSRRRRSCRSYAWFSGKTSDPDLRRLLEPVSLLLDGVKPGDKRWQRLEATHHALIELVGECNRVLRLPSMQNVGAVSREGGGATT